MKYGLIGEHLSYSFSKEIHELIDGELYELKEIEKKDLISFFDKREFKGINVTIPYKIESLKYLDFMDDATKSIGSTNTIVNIDNKLYGYNTDSFGINETFRVNNIDLKDKNALILGTGGASRSLYYVLKNEGANMIYFASRNIKDDIHYSYDDLSSLYDKIDIIINATPNGSNPFEDANLLIDLRFFKRVKVVFDLIYNPLKTKLLIEAEKLNIKAIDGLYMLVAQAVKANSIFKNKDYNADTTNSIYYRILKKKLNIALIGMPSSGKTTIAKLLAKKYKMDYYDSDKLIVDEIKMPISEYFKINGENEFRKIESKLIKDLSLKNGSIISTGGGIVKDYNNIQNLKMNSVIIFIDRDLDKLKTTSSRPLSSNAYDLVKLYDERIDLYKGYADFIVENNNDILDTVNEIGGIIDENFGY